MAIKAKTIVHGVDYGKLRRERETHVEDDVEAVVFEEDETEEVEFTRQTHTTVLEHKKLRMNTLCQGKGGKLSSYMSDMLNTDK